MIFNVNAAAVAALALTMAVHAAPSPVVGLSILPDCDNDRNGHHNPSLADVSLSHGDDCDEKCRTKHSVVNAEVLNHSGDDCDEKSHGVINAEVLDHSDNHNSHKCNDCNDCKDEIRSAGRVLFQILEESHSVLKQVVRVAHMTERCSPEEAASKCGDDCNGFIGSSDGLSGFDLFFFGKDDCLVPSEHDALLSKRMQEKLVQYHYEC
ncbi:hypothetical protein IW261DRAFT_364132 [Armillaria novae-zelandiae]|uniref:Uncharacterized protein n=1 Tax=Armillaria novae-zelandiae TaxID=153914 RepID=A0AA39PQH2_9AGAR|nr:hypothetical protein IW261DRAFT_364132 [Armillaria novae-zelandiae]